MSQGQVRSEVWLIEHQGDEERTQRGSAGGVRNGTSSGQEMKGKQNMRWKIVGMGLLADGENLMKG